MQNTPYRKDLVYFILNNYSLPKKNSNIFFHISSEWICNSEFFILRIMNVEIGASNRYFFVPVFVRVLINKINIGLVTVFVPKQKYLFLKYFYMCKTSCSIYARKFFSFISSKKLIKLMLSITM